MRKPHYLKNNEVDELLLGLRVEGEEEIYNRIREKAFSSINNRDDMDDIFLDMYESMINRARGVDSCDKDLAKSMYIIASIMRRVAHELYRAYNRVEKRDNNRFLRLVSSSKNSE